MALVMALGLGLGWVATGSAHAQPIPPEPCAVDPNAPALPAWQALGGGAWWLPGAAGDTDAGNRGGIDNLLALREDPAAGGDSGATPRLWLVGSGPSPVYGRALAASLRCQLGRAPTDVIAPWSRPELVLGQQGLALTDAPRSWAQAEVIAAMAERCPRCIERLRLRLVERADDLVGVRVDLPAGALHGERGQLGPLHWWRVPRGDTVLTLWWHPASGTLTGHGLLWTDGAPDLRDTDIDAMLAALDTAEAIAAALAKADGDVETGDAGGVFGVDGVAPEASDPARRDRQTRRTTRPPLRWLPEQGPLAPADPGGRALPAQHRRYWLALREAVERAQARGSAETELPTALPGVDPAWLASPRHALNWQRAWRQAEDAWQAAGPEPAP